MATIRKMWRCTNSQCKNDAGKNRGYKKVCTGEKSAKCKHCGQPMKLSDNHTTRIMKDGQTFTKSVSPNKEDAAAYLAHCVTSRHSGALLPGEERLIAWSEAKELFIKVLDNRLVEGKSKATDRGYRSRLNTLSLKFGKRYLQSIERFEVDDWIKERQKVVGPSDVKNCLTVLHMIYKTVLDRYSTKRFPQLQETALELAKVSKPTPAPGRDNILETEDQIQTLLDECRTPVLYHFTYGVLNTGLRHTDMLKLKSSEILWVRNEIVTLVKGGKQVRIPITENYGAFLEEWIKNQKVTSIHGWLFPATMDRNKCITVWTDIGWKAAVERCALIYEAKKDKATAKRFRNLKPHDLRHTFATHFLYKASKELGATAAVHILSQALGHSTSYITQRYSHALDEVNQAAMKSFGQQMFGGIKTVNLFQSV